MPIRATWIAGSFGIAAAVVLAGLVGGVFALRAFAQPVDEVIYACVGERSGALRVVDGPDDCLRGEESLSWDSQSQAGLAGYEQVTEGPFLANPGGLFGRSVDCPGGKVALGGGVRLTDGQATSLRVVQSFPSSDVAWFTVVMHEGGPPSMDLLFYAVCADASS